MGSSIRPSRIAGSGCTSSLRIGESQSSGERNSNVGELTVAAWKWRPAAAVMPVFQPCGITDAAW